MTLIRVTTDRATDPRSAVLEVLNASAFIEVEGDEVLRKEDLSLGKPHVQKDRKYWLWTIERSAPRCFAGKKERYSVEMDTGAARRRAREERWVIREGVVVQRSNGEFDVALNESLSGTRRLVDDALSSPTGAFRPTVS